MASRIGLRDGDEILSVNGRRIGSERDFYRSISQSRAGQRIPVEIWRDGDRRTVYWTGAFQQGQQGQQYSSNTADYNQEGHAFLGVQLDQRFPNAAVVQQVYRNSPAAQAGLRPGDWIVSVNGQRVSSSQELTREVSQLEPGAAVQIQISRPTTQNMQVRLGDRQEANQASYEEDSRSYQTGSRNQYDESGSSGRSSNARSGRSSGSSNFQGSGRSSGSATVQGSGRYSDDRSEYQSGENTNSSDDDSDNQSSRSSTRSSSADEDSDDNQEENPADRD